MSQASAFRPRPRRPRALASLLAASMLVAAAAAACSGGSSGSMPATMAPATMGGATADAAPALLGAMTMPTQDEVDATWAARPDYVRQLPQAGQDAYAFALARPDLLQWMPCYCGCVASGHRSNLDCFFQRREVKGNYSYEQHASYCDICVRTANLASQLLSQGKSAADIRAAVDATFGGAAPGTHTPQPPA